MTTRTVTTKLIYSKHGGDINPPTEVIICGDGKKYGTNWCQIYIPKPRECTSPFEPGYIVQVKSTYTGELWANQFGIVMNVNPDGVLVEFGHTVENGQRQRRFRHSTDALALRYGNHGP